MDTYVGPPKAEPITPYITRNTDHRGPGDAHDCAVCRCVVLEGLLGVVEAGSAVRSELSALGGATQRAVLAVFARRVAHATLRDNGVGVWAAFCVAAAEKNGSGVVSSVVSVVRQWQAREPGIRCQIQDTLDGPARIRLLRRERETYTSAVRSGRKTCDETLCMAAHSPPTYYTCETSYLKA